MVISSLFERLIVGGWSLPAKVCGNPNSFTLAASVFGLTFLEFPVAGTSRLHGLVELRITGLKMLTKSVLHRSVAVACAVHHQAARHQIVHT